MTEDHKTAEDHKPKLAEADPSEADEQPEPTNRAERRAMKKNKGKNQTKGVSHGIDKAGFNPKDVKVAGHKEFTNRKSG